MLLTLERLANVRERNSRWLNDPLESADRLVHRFTAELKRLVMDGDQIPKTMLPPSEWGVFVSYGELAAASGLSGVVLNHRLHDITDYDRAQR